MDDISEKRLSEVHPKLAERVRSMAAILDVENIHIRVTQGMRSWKEQEALYAQGRNAPGSIVTNAKAGHSWHNYACAVDVAPFDGGLPDWNINHPAWKRIVEVGQSVGLTAGAEWRTFPDWPHFQLEELPDSPNDTDRQDFLDAGAEGVWQEHGLAV